MSERLSDEEVEELARVYWNPVAASQLLAAAGIDQYQLPTGFDYSLRYWQQVAALLDQGAFPGGRRKILARAAADYPANPVFVRQLADLRSTAATNDTAPTTSSIAPDGLRLGNSRVVSGGESTDAYPESVHGTVLAIDIVRFSAHGLIARLTTNRALAELLATSAVAAGIPSGQIQSQDHGDGFLVFIPSVVPVSRVVSGLVDELRAALRKHNGTRGSQDRLRLRLALHEGHVVPSAYGWSGAPIVLAVRLLDSAPFRTAMETRPDADLGLILSDELYRSAVAHGRRGLDPTLYREVEVEVEAKAFRARAWLMIPDQVVQLGRAVSGPFAAPGDPAVQQTDGSAPDPERTAPRRAAAGEKWDFFVSAAEEDANWADWISWQLAEDGYTVRLESWDLVAGNSSVGVLKDAVDSATWTIVVLSPAYLSSERLRTSWQITMGLAATGARQKLIPVRVAPCYPDGMLGGVRYIDLVGRDEDDAKTYLQLAVRRAVDDSSYRPQIKPPFPGRA
ncbi:toll/interleukin-1 receptor domain-containing protein [Pseudofrankia inefficax]|uniref:TIR domain-containing protein n=1 Tax=Pseudofrankia inefficax (strain DSM 45817 / CECT 9037 / DDB 130130 / EuI1c) TaxID=298654 RepID=E3J6T2_PSEI1|nr:toll/interleukin-1 receptor domain-containing protein [Pseudofrankia inefficax]ADP82006.1 hypothetical protein FraEuI1c_4002 [Pseudofrankia inefficax]